MSELPSNWTVASFEEINQFSSQTVDPSTRSAELFELYSVPSFPSRQPEHVAGAAIGSTKQTVSPSDVLVCKINPRINRVWTVGLRGPYEQLASSEWIGFRSAVVHPSYANHYFSSPDFRALLCSEVAGVGGSLTRAQPKKVASYPIPVAPAKEQIRIVDQLDALLARIRACNDRIVSIPALLKRLRHVVLEAALQGRLADDEKLDDTATVSMPISDVAYVGTGSTPLRSNNKYFASAGTPWITSAATSQSLITQANEFVTAEAMAAHRLRQYPKGTLLVAMYGEGKTRGQVSELGIEATINQACAAIVVDERKALAAYVKLALQANYLAMRDLAEGGSQPNLNLSKIKNFEIPLPSLAKQRETVRRTQNFISFIDGLYARYNAVCAQAQRLTPLLLAKAFRGELVAQDPNDEPASELLARLSDPSAASKRQCVMQRTLQPKPAPVVPLPVDWQLLPDGAWTSGAADPVAVHIVHLAAVLNAWGAPAPAAHVRLAALLSLRPDLLPACLDEALLRQWRRLVGAEADPLPAEVARISPRADTAWRQAVSRLRARGELIEDTASGTWAPGPGLEHIDTRGWPDGRAGWLVHLLRSHGVDALLPATIAAEQAFGHAQAA